MVKFSVITVCWNNLNGLIQTEESVRSQQFNDYEWIIVDGNSSDGTKAWLNKLNGDFITWVSEKDKGIFDAMNKGLDMAKGDNVIFMNSGDMFADIHVLSKVYEGINKYGDKMLIYGNSIDIREDGKELSRIAKPLKHVLKGMFTQHQAMFYNNKRGKDIKYRLEFPITADYAYTCEYYKNLNDESDTLYLDFPICKFSLGGLNEQKRFKALGEDYDIRTQILKMSPLKARFIWLLHFVHTIGKRTAPGLMQKFRYS
ncbi:MAG: glycosyltransferase [Bacteroidetes bacterium]|jgi:putative colanic acid biosynthesis glycosyltransferase|nr:glycosyltransferase [Bacteroidota bacterium]